MTHFPVLVIIKNREDDSIYRICPEKKCTTKLNDAEYLCREHIDIELSQWSRQWIQDKPTYNINAILGTALDPYSENKEVTPYADQNKEDTMKDYIRSLKYYKKELKQYGVDQTVGVLPDEETQKKIQLYNNIITTGKPTKEWADDYNGQILSDNGELMTTYNPDSEWDWWVIGGRWSNYMTDKDDQEINFLLKKDLNRPTMDKKKYDEFYKLYQEGVDMVNSGKEIDPMSGDWIFTRLPEKDQSFEDWTKNNNYTPYWLLKYVLIYDVATGSNNWISTGKAGWWGSFSSNNEFTDEEWEEAFNNIVSACDPNDLLVIIDCHI